MKFCDNRGYKISSQKLEVVDFIDPGVSWIVALYPSELIRNEKVGCSIHLSGTKNFMIRIKDLQDPRGL